MIDAHCHLHFPILRALASPLVNEMAAAGISSAIVNGTCEEDWPDVAALCAKYPSTLRPAYGLHPWKIHQRTPHWRDQLAELLTANPTASIGECGIDRWRKDLPLDLQIAIFTQHIELSRQHSRPLSIHGLKAWSSVYEALTTSRPLPTFLLHSYSGPAEMILPFAKLGAYFSFSAYFFEPRKKHVLEMFRLIPADRLVIETDAPDMKGPADLYPEFAQYSYHHPRSLPRTLELLAGHLNQNFTQLAQQTTANAIQLFVAS